MLFHILFYITLLQLTFPYKTDTITEIKSMKFNYKTKQRTNKQIFAINQCYFIFKGKLLFVICFAAKLLHSSTNKYKK